jgi:hypothetical protein
MMALWESLPDFVRSTVFIVTLTIVLILCVAYLTLWERKLIGWMARTAFRLEYTVLLRSGNCPADPAGHDGPW